MTRQQAGVSAIRPASDHQMLCEIWDALLATAPPASLREDLALVIAQIKSVIGRCVDEEPYPEIRARLVEVVRKIYALIPEINATAPPEQADVDDERVWTEPYPAERVLPPTVEHMPKWQPQAASAGALDAKLTDLTHTRSCPLLNPMSMEFCTCGLEWRIKLRTEMEMHNAWRKRAEEAEAALAAHDQKVRAEALEEAARVISGSCKDNESETDEALTWAASRIRLFAETGK